jgi:hypothetical protein
VELIESDIDEKNAAVLRVQKEISLHQAQRTWIYREHAPPESVSGDNAVPYKEFDTDLL